MASRKHPEDSVIVSIGNVRDMLAEEVGRQQEVTQPRLPVPMAVPTEVVGGVPSWEEVGASRQARWDQERVAPVRSMPPWRIWRRRLILAVAALVLVAATAAGLWWWWPPPGVVEGMAGTSRAAFQEARDRVALQDAASRQAELAREAERLRAQVAELESALVAAAKVPVAAPPSEAETAEIIEKKVIKPRVATRRAKVVLVDRPADPVRPKRPPRKPRTLNKTDEKLDSLLNGL